jgi:toxin ParE1/3/4
MSAILSPRAKQDIGEIWDYTATHWDIDQAEHYIRQIQAVVRTLAHNPTIGRPCDEIRRGYCKYPAGSHVVFHRHVPDGIEIVRVLHNRMDTERQL